MADKEIYDDGITKLYPVLNVPNTPERNASEKTVENIQSRQEQSQQQRFETMLVIPPDGGWGWIVVAGAFVTFFIADGLIYGFGIFLKAISESLGCLTSQIALTGAIMTGFFCLFGPFVAALVNRFGYRPVAISGSLLASLSCLLTSMATSPAHTYATHGLLGGFGFGMMYMPAMIAIGYYFERWRALATGVAVCGSGMGGILMPPFMSTCIERYGWRTTFRIIAAFTASSATCGILYRPLKPTRITTANVPVVLENESSGGGATDGKGGAHFSRFHNASYPTVAEVHSKAIAAAQSKVKASFLASEGIPQTEAFSTVTIYRTEKRLDLDTTSSEFVMETTASNVTNYSRASVKANKQDAGDAKLSTIYEEASRHKKSCRKRCCRKKRNISKEDNDEDDDDEDCDPQETCTKGCHVRWKKIVACGKGDDQDRPLYRDDIFYSGSLALVPEYQCSSAPTPKDAEAGVSSKSKPSIEYGMRVTRTATPRETLTDKSLRPTEPCSPAIRTLATMLDFGLLRSRVFVLLTLHAVFISFGFYTPYLFVRERALSQGMTQEDSLWLISSIGVANTIGRITCGFVSTFLDIKSITISYASLLVAGVATIVSGYWFQTEMQFAYAALYGFCVACMSALRTVMMVELLGLERLTNAIGIMLLFQGMASLPGTALAGALHDWTGDYAASFYFAGGCVALGALVLVPLSALTKGRAK